MALLFVYLALTIAVITRSPLLRVDTGVLHWDLHRRYPQGFTAINAYVVLGQRGPSTLVDVPCAAVFLADTVGLCTLYLDTHWVTDVLGGWLAGGLVLLATPRAAAWATARVEAGARRVGEHWHGH